MIEIGEPMEVFVRRFHQQGMSIEDMVKRTRLPRDYVERAIKTE